jgi:hypothetical protein
LATPCVRATFSRRTLRRVEVRGVEMSFYQYLKRSMRSNAVVLGLFGIGVTLPSASAYASDTFTFNQDQFTSIGV